MPLLVELNVLFPGGLTVVRDAFYAVWREHLDSGVKVDLHTTPAEGVPVGLERVSAKHYQAVMSRTDVRSLVARDAELARAGSRPTTIFRVWPDYQLEQQIDRSAPTVKADAAWRSYDARGRGIVWAVIDSGIQATHEHFQQLEIYAEAKDGTPQGRTGGLHRDFSHLVKFPTDRQSATTEPGKGDPLTDESGHGTHVAGIIAGSSAAIAEPDLHVASSKEPVEVLNGHTFGAGYVPRSHTGLLSGMAPSCELVSLKVMRRNAQGDWVTSSAAVIAALEYLRTEVNVDQSVLRVHGVNMSLGCEWRPEDYAAGQSPLCQSLTHLIAGGTVVVVSAGNNGSFSAANRVDTSAVLGSITEPAHAEDCIAVGSTHREAPHAFGVTWTSSKGPTLDGRSKPDLVAPGEWITSAAVGKLASRRGLPPEGLSGYAEESGTSMAAPHVSGVIAAFLSARPEFIGRPRQVKSLTTGSATDLGRMPYAQGAGLVDLMRMLSNI